MDTKGSVDVPRKSALVKVNIQATGVPPQHVLIAQTAFADVKRILRELGVPDRDVRETSVTVDKACRYGCSASASAEYTYRTALDVLLPTIDTAVALLGRVRGAAANTVSVGNIRFPLVDPESLVRTAQQLSIDALERQASAMATAMGGRLGDIVALRSSDNKASLLQDDRSSYSRNYDRTLDVYTTGRVEMFHNFG